MRAWDSWFANSVKLAMMTPRLWMVMPLVAARQSEVLMKTMERNRARFFSGTIDLFAAPEPKLCIPVAPSLQGKVIPFPKHRIARHCKPTTGVNPAGGLRTVVK